MTLRDVINAGFLHRERARFRAGASPLLGLVLEPAQGDGIVVDVRGVVELFRIDVAANGSATIGAFATPAAIAAALPGTFPADARTAEMRTRLSLHDARVTVYGLGGTRVVPINACTVAPYELPAMIAVPAPPRGLGIAHRRRTTNDGSASFSLGVTVALRVSALSRFEHVRVILDLDGSVRRCEAAEALLERERCDADLFPNAARAAGAQLAAADERTSAAARALPALVLAALRDALAASRA